MKTAGIIAEYNPFHRGHKYHIEETRRLTGADYVVAVMSGDFVQRGEPAIADKYMRARMALAGGADLVLEMPVVYAAASAEYFAMAGVGILDGLGCVDVLSFGSEWGSEEDYARYVPLLVNEPDAYREILQKELKKGKNFPQARAFAVSSMFPDLKAGEVEHFFAEPNHILGLEYMKALSYLNSGIKPLIIPRRGSHFHEKKLEGGFSSATAIREYLNRVSKTDQEKEAAREELSEILGPDPENCAVFLEKYFKGETVSWADLMPYLDYTFLLKKNVLGKYFGMNRELFGRFQKLFVPGLSFEELMGRLHARQLTDAALRRVLLHIVLHIKDQHFLEDAKNILLPYVRVLGFKRKAAPLLKEIRFQTKLNLIQRPVEGTRLYGSRTEEALLYNLDIRSADFYEQIAARKAGRQPVSEFKRQQIIV